MSKETTQWLNTNVLRGFTGKRGKAWHYSAAAQGSESNHYDGAIPVDDVLRRLMGWEAIPQPVYVPAPAGFVQPPIDVDGVPMDDPHAVAGLRKLTDRVAWSRSDTLDVLGIHSADYRGHQYPEWLIKNVVTILSGDAAIASAGLLSGGAVAWVQVEMPDNVTTPEGVVFRPFLMATTSFDGSIATTYKRGVTDVVCDNTRSMFLAESGETVRIKHTSRSGLRVAEVRDALGILFKEAEGFSAEVAALCSVDVSDRAWSKFLDVHVPVADPKTGDALTGRSLTMAENKRSALTGLWNTDTRVSPWSGTAWGVVQATNTYMHHMGTVRGVAHRFERNMMRAVQGKVADADRAALAHLSTALGRPLDRASLVGASA